MRWVGEGQGGEVGGGTRGEEEEGQGSEVVRQGGKVR